MPRSTSAKARRKKGKPWHKGSNGRHRPRKRKVIERKNVRPLTPEVEELTVPDEMLFDDERLQDLPSNMRGGWGFRGIDE